jgi:hypothetical protein
MSDKPLQRVTKCVAYGKTPVPGMADKSSNTAETPRPSLSAGWYNHSMIRGRLVRIHGATNTPKGVVPCPACKVDVPKEEGYS